MYIYIYIDRVHPRIACAPSHFFLFLFFLTRRQRCQFNSLLRVGPVDALVRLARCASVAL